MQRRMTESNYRPIFTSACIKTRHIVQATQFTFNKLSLRQLSFWLR